MNKLIKFPFVVTALTIALIGCSSNKVKVEDPDPNPLPKIQATQALQEIYKNSVSSSPKHDPLRYQMVRDGNVYYTADPDGDVQAFKGNEKLWKVRPSKDLTAGVTVGQGAAVVGDRQGILYVLDAETGKTLWKQALTGSILSPSKIVSNRVITITNDGTVFAHDIASGQSIWTFKLPDASLSMRGYAAPFLLDDRTVGIAASAGYVYALDVITGVPRWQRRVAVSEGRGEIQRLIDVDGTPVVVADKLVSVSYQGQVTVLDLTNQQVIWSEKASSLNSPAANDSAVYVAGVNGHLIAYDIEDGHKLWDNDQLAYRKLSNPVILGNVLVVGDLDGYLHLINPETGKITGRVKTSGSVRTLRVENDLLYVATTKGNFSVWKNS